MEEEQHPMILILSLMSRGMGLRESSSVIGSNSQWLALYIQDMLTDSEEQED